MSRRNFTFFRNSQLLAVILVTSFGLLLQYRSAAAMEPLPSQHAVDEIDRHLSQLWQDLSITPAPRCSDEIFIRRVSLDLLGRVPTVAETRDFLQDSHPRKREQLVDRLLMSPDHDRQLANFLRTVWLPQTTGPGSAQLAQHFEAWFVDQLRQGAGYDTMVYRILTLPANRAIFEDRRSTEEVASTIFEAVSESKPETLASNATRAFLGLNLDCAQCHDHPFADWSQQQFWEQAAFFTRPLPVSADQLARLEIQVVDQSETVVARFLDGEAAVLPEQHDHLTGRRLFADWIAARQNPYLARNAVNRMWARFCGAGIIEPLDDISSANPPVAPHLLETLTTAFLQANLDLRELERVIVLSAAYQRSSSNGVERTDELRYFARHPIRGLQGEQLYDSLMTTSGYSTPRLGVDPYGDLQRRYDFAMRFQVERAEQSQRSILQALTLMNGELVIDATASSKSPAIRSLSAPFLTNEQRVNQLFLAAFSRYPTPQERQHLCEWLSDPEPEEQQRLLSNLFWAMLNSAEFNTNH